MPLEGYQGGGPFHVPESDAVIPLGDADEEEVTEGVGVEEGGDGCYEAGSFDLVDLRGG